MHASAAASPLVRLPDGVLQCVLDNLDAHAAETLGRALPPLLPVALKHSRDRLAAVRHTALAALRPLVDKFKRALYAGARQQVLEFYDADSLCLVDTDFCHAGLYFVCYADQCSNPLDMDDWVDGWLSWEVHSKRPVARQKPDARMTAQFHGRRGIDLVFNDGLDVELTAPGTPPVWIVPMRLALSMACAEFNRVPVHFVSHHRAAE